MDEPEVSMTVEEDRLARRAALRDYIDACERENGPIPELHRAAARAAFDELDGIVADPRS